MNARVPEGWIEVWAPATVANVGPGYDCFGFAVRGLGDVVRARAVSRPGVRLVAVHGDGGRLPRRAEENTAGRAALSVWRGAAIDEVGLEIELHKGLPICSGLGSSAASAVAGALAATFMRCQVTGESFSEPTLIEAALDGESLAAGARHGDNVVPAAVGGFTVVQSTEPLRYARIEPALELHVALAVPDLQVSTSEARARLPRQVALADAVRNWSNAAAMVAALCTGDVELLRASLDDRVVEPVRAQMVPGFAGVKAAAVAAGALGCSLSGSGPAVFALALDAAAARSAARAMAEAFAEAGVSCQTYATTIDTDGARRR